MPLTSAELADRRAVFTSMVEAIGSTHSVESIADFLTQQAREIVEAREQRDNFQTALIACRRDLAARADWLSPEAITQSVWDFPEGCDEGKRRFLRHLGVLSPVTYDISADVEWSADDAPYDDAREMVAYCVSYDDDGLEVTSASASMSATVVWTFTDDEGSGPPDSYELQRQLLRNGFSSASVSVSEQ